MNSTSILRKAPSLSMIDRAIRLVNADMPPTPELYTSKALYDFTMDARCPLVSVVIYLALVALLNGRDKRDRTKGPVARSLIVLHNALLCVYSAWTSAIIWPVMIRSLLRNENGSFSAALCGMRPDGNWVPSQWVTDIGPVSYLFYLSKYYEIADSIILLLKGKRISPLQSFHHSGAILTMFFGLRFGAATVWLFPSFNGVVHSARGSPDALTAAALMYAYYAVTALKIRVPGVIKRSLTTIQIAQFYVGFSIAASYLFIRLPASFEDRRCLPTDGQIFFTFLVVFGYGAPLTLLFLSFYAQTYTQKSHSKTA